MPERARAGRSGRAVLLALGLLVGASPAPLAPRPAAAEETMAAEAATAGSQALARGDNERALELLGTALADTGLANDRRASLLNDRGIAAWRLGRYRLAIEDFNGAVTIYPEFAAAYSNRGNVLLALGKPEEAVLDFDRAILLAPNYVAAFNNRAIARIQLGQAQLAIADFGRAAELAPGSPAPVSGRGRAQLAVGRHYAALRDFGRALAIDPNYKVAYQNRAQARLGLGQAAEAVDDLTIALGLAPEDAALLLARGQAHLMAKAHRAALQDLEKALELRPSASVLAVRGKVLARLGDHEAALADFAKALELDPRTIDAYLGRAWTHKEMGASEIGLADVERALKLDADSAEAHLARAEIEEALGRTEPAIDDFRRALELDARLEEAWAGLGRLTGESRPAPTEVVGAEFEEWRVFVDETRRYHAVHQRFPKLRVPLEMYDEQPPRLLDWEVKSSPYKGIGVLRYVAGEVTDGKNGPAELQQAVIVDVWRGTIIGVEPQALGSRTATWSWEAGEVTIKGIDGLTMSYKLREAVARATPRKKRPSESDDGWGIWDNGASEDRGAGSPRPRRAKGKPQKKPKSLFDLFF